MKQLIGFDYRFIWQDGSPTEHGSPAELCFKARHGVETVICRVPRSAILHALHDEAVDEEDLDPTDAIGDGEKSRICEALYVSHRQIFRTLAQNRIMAGAFAEPMGYVKSILIGEDELIRELRETALLH